MTSPNLNRAGTIGKEAGMGVTSEDISRVLDAVPSELLIGGKWVATKQKLDVEDPSTGEVLTSVADASTEEGMAALDAAVEASEGWKQTDPRERGEILRRAFTLLTERAEDIALLMTLEMGKPLAESRTEVTYGAEFLRWFSEEAVRIAGRYSMAPSGGTRLVTVKQPVGPAYAITPWNFPLAMGTRKLGPALAAGCTVVIKPAALTPLTTLNLAAILIEAGLPDGVVNVITTSRSGEVSSPIMADPRLRKITFTGSTEVGRRLIEQSAQQVLRISMELGGNAPFLILADADLDKAVDGAMLAKMRNIGEACTAANRFLVHESLANEFASRLAERMGALTIGRGVEDGVEVGPLIDSDAVDKVSRLVADAVDSGAKILTGGSAVDGPGHFYRPTVLSDVPPTARVFREEIFGPVAPVITFGSEDEGIELANDTEFGLVAYAYTESLTKAITVAERLETGMVGINQGIVSNPAAPFGGVKASGLGREGGHEGIEEYLETKYVGIRL
jgi:succinate-semialdehyde dehydrogenase/glutarate-semialdehyde dehydrogenase